MKKLFLIAACAVLGAVSSWAGTVGGDAGPFGVPIFVRGGFNDWGTVDAMTWDAADQSFEAIVTVAAGDWEFKIADDGWSNPDFGATGDPNIVLGTPTAIGTGAFSNFMLSLASPTTLLFRLSDIAGDLQSGTLLVRAVPIPAALVLFASGLAGFGALRRRRQD